MTAVLAGVAGAVTVLFVGSGRRLPRPRVRRQRSTREIRLPRRHDIDLGVLATDVATRLRAGLGVEQAWRVSLRRAGLPERSPVLDGAGSPRALVELDARRGAADELRALLKGEPLISSVTRIALPSLLAATRLTWQTGAPMADVLDECAAGLTEAGEAQSAREIALQGPKSTAAMLAWLPLLGVGLGVVMGVDPLGFLTGTGVGRVFLVAGLIFEIAGILIVRRMVFAAQMEGAVGRAT